MPEMCRICRVIPADSFEHVPPRKAFNDEPTTSFTIIDWLAREEGGLTGGKIEQRGAGDLVLCQRCNNNTGSWYGSELVRAAGAGARILNELPLDELDASLEHAWATVKFKQQPKIGPHPLRLAAGRAPLGGARQAAKPPSCPAQTRIATLDRDMPHAAN